MFLLILSIKINQDLKVLPIIVAFPIDGESLDVLYRLNQKCDLEKGIDFNTSQPHITLWMGFVSEIDALTLKKEFYNVFGNISMKVEVERLELFAGVEGEVLSASIKKSKMLYLLQNRVHHYFEPYRYKPSTYGEMNDTTVHYVNLFYTKSLEKYDPHITVGFSNKLLDLPIDSFVVSEPKIYLAGNNCTCLKVID